MIHTNNQDRTIHGIETFLTYISEGINIRWDVFCTKDGRYFSEVYFKNSMVVLEFSFCGSYGLLHFSDMKSDPIIADRDPVIKAVFFVIISKIFKGETDGKILLAKANSKA